MAGRIRSRRIALPDKYDPWLNAKTENLSQKNAPGKIQGRKVVMIVATGRIVSVKPCRFGPGYISGRLPTGGQQKVPWLPCSVVRLLVQ